MSDGLTHTSAETLSCLLSGLIPRVLFQSYGRSAHPDVHTDKTSLATSVLGYLTCQLRLQE
jgi:hypothetical protein